MAASPSRNLSRDQILARKLGKGRATLADGSTVGIRGLNLDEADQVQELAGAARIRRVVELGMTDPKLSAADIEAWATEGGAGDLVTINEQIAKLSGLVAGAEKAAYKSV